MSEIKPGTYIGRVTDGGPFFRAPAGTPDAVVCRRVADYPGGQCPPGAALGTCKTCRLVVAFDPDGPHRDRPRICMQCAGIRPLPMEAS